MKSAWFWGAMVVMFACVTPYVVASDDVDSLGGAENAVQATKLARVIHGVREKYGLIPVRVRGEMEDCCETVSGRFNYFGRDVWAGWADMSRRERFQVGVCVGSTWYLTGFVAGHWGAPLCLLPLGCCALLERETRDSLFKMAELKAPRVVAMVSGKPWDSAKKKV